MATSCKELTPWKRLWCWEGLGTGGEGDNRGWDGWMASPTGWTWVWVNSGSWWWRGRPGVLKFMGSQRVRYDWATELNLGRCHLSRQQLKIGLWSQNIKKQTESTVFWGMQASALRTSVKAEGNHSAIGTETCNDKVILIFKTGLSAGEAVYKNFSPQFQLSSASHVIEAILDLSDLVKIT